MNKRILIVDDHEVVLLGTKIALQTKMGDLIIDTAMDYTDGINKISNEKFDLMILDINIPGSKNIKMISEITKIDPSLKILVFSAYEESVGIQYIKAGAHGYVSKLSKVDEISDAVTKIFSYGKYYPYSMVDQLFDASIQNKPINSIETLSEREYNVFVLLAKGLGNLEISNLLEVQMPTISTYKRRIYSKLKVTNLAELINLYNEYNR